MQSATAHRGEEAKIERMEEAEGAALVAAQRKTKSQRDEAAYQDYRAGERNAEAIAAEYQTRKALQDYRQGERAEVVVPPPVCTVENIEKPKPWWQQFAHNFIATATNPRDNIARAVGIIPDAWRGFLLSPLQVRKQKKGSNLVINVNQKTLNVVNSVTGWIEKRFPWTGIKTVPANKLGFYESLAEQNLDIKPTGSLSPKKWTDRLLDIVLGRESKTLVKEAADETAETAAKGGLRNTLKAVSPNLFDAVIEGAFNAYDYTLGEKKNETDKLQKWAVSSGVDLGGSLLTGALAAGTVAGVIGIIGYFAGAPITVPVTLIIGATIVVGAIFDMALEATGVKDVIKANLNNFIDSVQSLPVPTPAQPAVPIPTPPPAPQMYGTPTPPPTPTAPSVEPQIVPVQPPSTPTSQTPDP